MRNSKREKSIFDHNKNLTPKQVFTVAQRRFEDAEFLLNSGNNARLNAAMYLGGFVIECLLKGLLLEKLTALKLARGERLENKNLAHLVYRSHDLGAMLLELSDISRRIQYRDKIEGTDCLVQLEKICSIWTINARYSPLQANRKTAEQFLTSIKEIKKCVAGL